MSAFTFFSQVVQMEAFCNKPQRVRGVDIFPVTYHDHGQGGVRDGQLVFRKKDKDSELYFAAQRMMLFDTERVMAMYLADSLLSEDDVAAKKALLKMRDEIATATYFLRDGQFIMESVTDFSFSTRRLDTAEGVREAVICSVAGPLKWQ